MTKFCVDCKHCEFKLVWLSERHSKNEFMCNMPVGTSLVTGKPIIANEFCKDERGVGDVYIGKYDTRPRCGPTALHFQPK